MLRLWLDDDDNRPVPPGFDLHVKTAQEAIDAIASGQISEISLDHDLGPPEAGTGYDVAKWIEEQAYLGAIPKLVWSVHSANPVGAKNIRNALESAERYWAQHRRVLESQQSHESAVLVRYLGAAYRLVH